MPPAVVRRTLKLAGLEVPLVEMTGSGDGPVLTVIAGVHGCEYASMAGVRRWLRALEQQELRGLVRAVPVLNLTAFATRTPFVVPEDGKNLNRCFPGNPDGTFGERLAYAAFSQLISGSDAYIDAHCGDMVEALQPFALYEAGPAEARARDLATAYGLPYVIRQDKGPGRAVSGTSSGAAAEAGIAAITAEAGGCGLVEEHAVAMHVAGLNAVLSFLGMTDDGADPQPVRATHLPRAVPVAALPPGGLVAAGRGPGRLSRRGPGDRHGQYPRRRGGTRDHHRARRLRGHVPDQLARRRRRRPADRPRSDLTVALPGTYARHQRVWPPETGRVGTYYAARWPGGAASPG